VTMKALKGLVCLLFVCGCGSESATPAPTVRSPNANVPHLGLHGTFTADTMVPATLNDARNPKRIVLREMMTFSYYRDLAGAMPMAENCQYRYVGAAGDPHYYPMTPTSIWDLLELVSGPPACNAFRVVAFRSPHGNPVHMHFRYSDGSRNHQALLAMSNDRENAATYDPWWSTYCAEGVSGCDL